MNVPPETAREVLALLNQFNASAVRVLLYLAAHPGGRTSDEIAAGLRQTRTNIQHSLTPLRAAGALRVEQRPGARPGKRIHIYHLP